jgi:phosphoserine phosphatase RsbU/P
MLTPATGALRLSSAGHPPAILAAPHRAATTVQIRPDLPVGVANGHPRHTSEVPFPPGSVLCLYSDGLVERRDLVIDDNIDKLRATVTAQPPEAVCAQVMRQMIRTTTPEDDVAVLGARRHGPHQPRC